jgi:hypothetical protein
MLRLGALECVGEMAVMACEAIAVGVMVGGRMCWCEKQRENNQKDGTETCLPVHQSTAVV